MRRLVLLFTACVISITFLSGCHVSHQYVARKSTTPPKFMNDIYMDRHHKVAATMNAVEPVKTSIRRTSVEEETFSYSDKSSSKSYPVRTSAGKTQESDGETFAYTEKSSTPEAPVKTTPRVSENDNEQPVTLSRRETKDLRKKYSEILGVSTGDITNYTLYAFIDQWYGTNYRLGGCDKSGIDCSGFVQKLYNEVYGIDLSRTAKEQFSDSKHVKHLKKAEEGDLVFFHVNSRRITHVGIYLGNDFFVHASTTQGVIISNLNEEYWHKYFAGAGRIPKS